MSASKIVKCFFGGLDSALLNGIESALNPGNGISHRIQQLLIGFRILNHQFGLSVDRQDHRIARGFHARNEPGSVSLKVGQRMDVFCRDGG